MVGHHEACPPGTNGAGWHQQWCEIAECGEGDACPTRSGAREQRCEPMRVCTERFVVTTGWSLDEVVTEHVEVLATCAPGGTCDGSRDRAPTAGERIPRSRECSDRRVCVTVPFPPLADRLRHSARADHDADPTDAPVADAVEADPVVEAERVESERPARPDAHSDPPAAGGCGCRVAPARATPIGLVALGLVLAWRCR